MLLSKDVSLVGCLSVAENCYLIISRYPPSLRVHFSQKKLCPRISICRILFHNGKNFGERIFVRGFIFCQKLVPFFEKRIPFCVLIFLTKTVKFHITKHIDRYGVVGGFGQRGQEALRFVVLSFKEGNQSFFNLFLFSHVC